MSAQHFGAVLHEMPDLRNHAAAVVLMVIADSADRQTGYTFHFSVGRIATAARLSVRAARDRLRFLERERYIETEREGGPGRERLRFRLLFGIDGKRRSADELYSQPPAQRAGGKGKTPARGAAPPAHRAAPPAQRAAPPAQRAAVASSGTEVADNDRARSARARAGARSSVPSPSLSKEAIKKSLGGRKAKSIPPAEPAPDLSAERERQAAALKARMAAQDRPPLELEREVDGKPAGSRNAA